MTVATLNSRCAIAEIGKRRESARVPRTGAVDLARLRRTRCVTLK